MAVINRIDAICQSVFARLQGELGDSVYIARCTPFDIPAMPVTNIWPAEGDSAVPGRRDVTLVVVTLVAEGKGTPSLEEILRRQTVVHRQLLEFRNLDGRAQKITAQGWDLQPHSTSPVLMLTQRFVVSYQSTDPMEV
jgi:hypothetical protein